MKWIVTGPDKDNRVKLISKRGTDGVLPKGSYLTVIDETDGNKPLFILRVEESSIEYPYSPSHTIIDMDLQGIKADLKWQNHISARIVKDLNERSDGLVNPVSVLSIARRSNQEEVNEAMGYENSQSEIKGPKVFLATIHDNKNQILVDENQNFLFTHIRPDFIYHQTLVVGKTGSGKTVATKYLAQYFVEKEQGAVLAINVKDVDFLKMDRPSNDFNEQIEKEWDSLKETAHKIENFRIYYPATTRIKPTKGVNPKLTIPVSLDVKTIEPEALTGILRNITDIAAQYLPDIFRYWRDELNDKGRDQNISFNNFVDWFTRIHQREDNRNVFPIKNTRGDFGDAPLAHGTAANILRNLNIARAYFDDPDALLLKADDILSRGMMSVIDLEDERAKTFGSILLRHLLHQIVELKSSEKSQVPVLIIIDEVHQFYNTESSKEALGDLDTICRKGRSQEIGVIFSSQTPADIPKGLSNVINTKIFFKSDASAVKMHGVSVSDSEMQDLKKGFAVANIHEMPQLKMVKFPLAFAGVIKKGS
ncbi:ATP-binding protein [Methanoculleus sp.]|uniref:ATP-binding protein n=1 Tax=Methanoculleus sp. TaxID=90427 RepID=UPI001BD4105E|nr:helicase HerA-like domain-containing protein [Methanoculleus sp.]